MRRTHLTKNPTINPTMKPVAPFARSLETRTMPRLTPFSRRNPLALFLVALLAFAAWLPAAPAAALVESIVSVQYDAAGRAASVTLPSGRVVSYTYNEGAGEKSVALDGVAVVADTEFSVLGQPERTTLAATHGWAGGETLRAYDDLGRLSSQETQLADESLPEYAARNLQYDAWGFLATYERDDLGVDAPILHSRDGQGRLDGYFVAAQPVAYTYDAAGNLRSRSAVVAAGLDLPALATVDYDASNRRVGWSYDADGRLLEDDRYRYRYDRAGRLAVLFDHEGDLVAHYLYDADGRRVRTMDDESIVYTTRDLAGGVVEVFELDAETGATVEHRETVLHAGQAALEVKTASGSTTYEHTVTDRLGNPVARVEGGQRERQEYSPYGLQVLVGANEHRGAHGFTGMHEDDETDLVYMQARYYDPALGRFQTPDPARDFDLWRPSTLNLYQYAYTNPIDHVDPDGLEPITLLIGTYSAAEAVGDLFTRAHTIYLRHKLYGAEDAKQRAVEEGKGFVIEGAVNLITKGVSKKFKAGKGWFKRFFSNADEAQCFAAGTVVHTPDGLVPIEELKIGDLVISGDPSTSERTIRPIVRLFVTANQPIWSLEVAAEDGSVETYEVTGEHPFWTKGRGWVPVSLLLPEDQILTATDAWLEVRQIRGPPTAGTVYNFEVAEDHTYFVGDLGAWVHNTCAKKAGGKTARKSNPDRAASAKKRVKALEKRLKEKGGQMTKRERAEIQRRIKHLRKKAHEKSEPHAIRGQGHRN